MSKMYLRYVSVVIKKPILPYYSNITQHSCFSTFTISGYNSCVDKNVMPEPIRDYRRVEKIDDPDPIQIEDTNNLKSEWTRDLTRECIESNPGPGRTKSTRPARNNKPQTKIIRSNNQNQTKEGYTVIPPEMPNMQLVPFQQPAHFSYSDATYQRFNAGANYLVYAIRINDVYDPDPLILSGSVSGYKEKMQFYNFCKVNKFRALLTIANTEAFPLMYGIVFNRQNLVGVISNRDDAVNALETGVGTGTRMIAAKGGLDLERISCAIQPWKVLGNFPQYISNDDYACQIATSPAKQLFMHIIIASPSGVNIANGVIGALICHYDCLLYDRVNLRA